MLVISWSALYFFTSHPLVFIKSTSDPKFNAIIFPLVYISFVTNSIAGIIYRDNIEIIDL